MCSGHAVSFTLDFIMSLCDSSSTILFLVKTLKINSFYEK